jgi:lysophospholipase L1-like esterase
MSLYYRLLCTLSLFVCVMVAAPGVEDFDISKIYKTPTDKWESKIKEFEALAAKNPIKEGGIVAVGSSSIAMWHNRIEKDLAPLTIIKRGFGGSNFNDAIHYVHRIVTNYKPRAILVYEGDNDIAQKVSPENVARACQLFIETVREKVPAVRIYIISIKPSIKRQEMWADAQKANGYIKELCAKTNNLTFIDVGEVLLNKDGSVMTDIFVEDNLHLNSKGYDLWAVKIKQVLMAGEAGYEK